MAGAFFLSQRMIRFWRIVSTCNFPHDSNQTTRFSSISPQFSHILLLKNVFGAAGNLFGTIGALFRDVENVFGTIGALFRAVQNVFGACGTLFGAMENVFGICGAFFRAMQNVFGTDGKIILTLDSDFGNHGNTFGIIGIFFPTDETPFARMALVPSLFFAKFATNRKDRYEFVLCVRCAFFANVARN